jgi:hypothetical protein
VAHKNIDVPTAWNLRLLDVAAQPLIRFDVTNHFAVTWSSVAGQYDRLQYEDNPNSANWSELPVDIPATDTTTTTANAIGGAAARFHRIRVVP